MRRAIVVLGFFIIVLVVTGGCTSTQNPVANGSQSQNAGTGSVTANAPASGFSSPSSQVCLPKTDMHKFKPFFPDMAGYQRSYKNENSGDVELNKIEEKYTDNKNFLVDVYINDFSDCDVDTNSIFKNIKVGDTDHNNTISSLITSTYRGYPATRIEVTDNDGDVIDVFQSITINPKIIVSVNVLSYEGIFKSLDLSNQSMSNYQGTPKSTFDAEIDKFVNALDLNGIITVGNTANTITRPISLTAQYNPDGTITVTSNGGPAAADLSVITVSVNGGKLRDKLDPQAGSTVTVQGIPGSKNRIIAVGAFRNGTHQVVLETDVGPNP
jgi:hypothetical protein